MNRKKKRNPGYYWNVEPILWFMHWEMENNFERKRTWEKKNNPDDKDWKKQTASNSTKHNSQAIEDGVTVQDVDRGCQRYSACLDWHYSTKSAPLGSAGNKLKRNVVNKTHSAHRKKKKPKRERNKLNEKLISKCFNVSLLFCSAFSVQCLWFKCIPTRFTCTQFPSMCVYFRKCNHHWILSFFLSCRLSMKRNIVITGTNGKRRLKNFQCTSKKSEEKLCEKRTGIVVDW